MGAGLATHRPGSAAISSMFSMQDAVSTCRATMTLSLWTPAYPCNHKSDLLQRHPWESRGGDSLGSYEEALLKHGAVARKQSLRDIS